MIFTRQLATLIDSGLPLLRGSDRAGQTGAESGAEDAPSTRWPTPCRPAAPSPKSLRAASRDLQQALRQHGQGRRSSAGCSKSSSTVWPSTRKRRRSSRTRSSRRWCIPIIVMVIAVGHHRLPPDLHRSEVREDLRGHARAIARSRPSRASSSVSADLFKASWPDSPRRRRCPGGRLPASSSLAAAAAAP